MEFFYNKNNTDIEASKIFEIQLNNEENNLRKFGFFVEFIQDTKKRTDILTPNAFLISTCKIVRANECFEAFECGHESWAKYKALLEALKKYIG
jgi:hypothetical protein